MNSLIEVDLNNKAVGYVNECLADGRTLAKLLLEFNNLSRGKIITYLPPDISPKDFDDFSYGGKIPSPYLNKDVQHRSFNNENKSDLSKLNPKYFLVETIYKYISANENRLCIFEDASASPNDPFIRSINARISTYNDEVYYLLINTDSKHEQILKTIKAASSWLFIGVMTSLERVTDLPIKNGDLSLSILTKLASRTEKIVVGAYDNESYLIWSKNPTN